MRRVPDGEVGAQARSDAAAIGQPERGGGMAGDARQRLLRRQTEEGAGHVHRKRERGHRRGAGVHVGGHGHRHPVPSQKVDRRQFRLAKRVEGSRQDDSDGAGGGHCRDALLVQILEMVGRQRPVSGRECRAAEVRELFGVKLDRQAERPGSVEDPADLLR